MSELRQAIDEIERLENPNVSPEMWALAEQVCAHPHQITDANAAEWARQLASDLVDADLRNSASSPPVKP